MPPSSYPRPPACGRPHVERADRNRWPPRNELGRRSRPSALQDSCIYRGYMPVGANRAVDVEAHAAVGAWTEDLLHDDLTSFRPRIDASSVTPHLATLG